MIKNHLKKIITGFLFLTCGQVAMSQTIYHHDFGTSTFTAVNPYGVAPTTIDANLSASQWSTSVVAGFTSFAGSTGQALSVSNSGGTPTYSLSYAVGAGFNCDISAFSFWRQRSGTGAQNWTLTVNGITTIGAGTTPTVGVSTGTVAVSSAANGLSGNVNVVLRLGGASGTGSFRLDDFTLYGTVYSTVVCTPPTVQASSYISNSITANSATVGWTSGNGNNVIVLAHQSVPVNASPANGIAYTANSIFASGQQIGVGNYVVFNGVGNSVNVTGLASGIDYYFSVYEYNSPSNCYLTPALTGSLTTIGCITPTVQATLFTTSAVNNTSQTISWTSGNGGSALVLAHESATVNATPVNGSSYTANGTFGLGQQLGTSNYAVYNGAGNSVTITGLNPGTDYYFSVFEYNNAGNCYLLPPLSGSVITTNTIVSGSTCLKIKTLLIDACGSPESYNEMVYFQNGSNPLPINQISIAGAPNSGVYALNKWPNNGNLWNGAVQTATTASNVAAINSTITACGYVLEPPQIAGIGTIPPFANVILVGSQTMLPYANSFSNLTDTVYMIFQSVATTTAGHFSNYSAGPGTRGFVIIDNLHGCTSNSVTYQPGKLTNLGDGDATSYDIFNNITNFNSGCTAPFSALTVNAGLNQTICYNSQAVLTATPSGIYNAVTWSGGSGVFSSPSSLTTTYTPSATEIGTGTVSLMCTITRSCAASTASVTDIVIVSITSLPVFSITTTNGYSLCPSSTSVLSYSITNAANAGVITPSWSSPTGSATTYTVSAPSGTASVNYTVNLTNTCGNTLQTFTVYPLVLPTVTLSATTLTACAGNTLNLTASGNTGNYSWNNPVSSSSVVTITPNTTTTGIVTSTNSCGSASDTYTLTVTPQPTISVSPTAVSLCTGQSATLTATSNVSNYLWSTSATTNTISVNTAGTYTVGVSNVCNTASATVNVVVNSAATLTISTTSSSVCANGLTIATLTLTGSVGSYTWSNGVITTTPTLSISTPGVYSATVNAGSCGFGNASVVTIGALPTPTISVTPSSTLLCNGATATLTASSNLTNYTWTGGSTNTNSIIVNATGLYTVGVTNACGSSSAAITILASITPTLNLTSTSNTLCSNETATLTVTGGTQPYLWSNSTNTSSVVTTAGGTVSVSSTNACGTGSQTVVVNTSTVVVGLAGTPIIGSQPLTVSFTNSSLGASTYTWNYGNGTTSNGSVPISQTYTTVGTYTVSLSATNSSGCSDSQSILITVTNEPAGLVIPNVFTPNGDNVNDVFYVKATNMKDFNCVIFDRWGLQLYSWSDVKGGWDGASGGKVVTDGTYFYIINATDLDGKDIKKQGAITLLR